MTIRNKKILSICMMGIVILLMCAIFWFVGKPMIQMLEEPADFRAWVDEAGVWGRGLFVGMVVLQVVVAIIPGEPVELAAGYAFGFWEGTFLTMVGFLLGSWIVFALVRRFGRRMVELFFSEEKLQRIQFLQSSRKIQVISFLLMLIPGTPKDMLSYFAGLTNLTTIQWIGIVSIARLPSLVTSTFTGAAAGEERYLLSAISMGLTLVLTLCGIWYYRRICKEEAKV